MNRIYNNSEAAIQHNITKGFKWFEIDFLFIEDCLVTEADRAAVVTGNTTASYYSAKDEGKAAAEKLEGTQSMTLDDLAGVMREHPEMMIVPDVKDVERNEEAMALMMERLPEAGERVVPQIFQPEEFLSVNQMGFKHIIWTLYNFTGTDEDVLSALGGMDLAAVTMPIARAEAGMAHRVREMGLPTLAHTVNDPKLLRRLQQEWGVCEVYSDFVAPCDDELLTDSPPNVPVFELDSDFVASSDDSDFVASSDDEMLSSSPPDVLSVSN